jgi:hypothetical protein
MKIFLSTVRYLIIFLCAVVISAALPTMSIYQNYFPTLFLPNSYGAGFDIDFGLIANSVTMLFLNLGLILPFLFILLGDRARYWVAGIGLLLLLTVDFFIVSNNVVMPAILVLIGLLLGILLSLLISKTLGTMPMFASLKKYF